jgi:hypothetical protein
MSRSLEIFLPTALMVTLLVLGMREVVVLELVDLSICK